MYLTRTLFCLSVVTATVVDDQPYCSVRYRRLCQGKGQHVACQFPYPGPGESCENYTRIKFSEDMQNFVIHNINRKRQRLAAGNERVRGGLRLPRPALMMQVEWDRELATLAQRLADQCNFVHDDCRATVRYPYAGQTVGEVKWRSIESDEITARRAIRRVLDAWWGERRRVTPQQLTAPFRITAKGTVWGHFSQLAVWSLRAVGCGAVRHGSGHPKLLLVCDYSHTNMLGQRTVSPGPVSACPINTMRRSRSAYPLLCATIRQPRIPDYDTNLPDEQQYHDYEDTETERTTQSTRSTRPTSEFISLTAKTTVSLTLPTTTVTELVIVVESDSSPSPVVSTETSHAKPKHGLATLEGNIYLPRKDEQADPLVHRYDQVTSSGFVHKLQKELEGRYAEQRRYHALAPEKLWRQTQPAYFNFRETLEKRPDIDRITLLKSPKEDLLTIPSQVHNRGYIQNADHNNEALYGPANKKDYDPSIKRREQEQRQEIFKQSTERKKAYDPEQRKYASPEETKDFYESSQINAADDLIIERKEAYQPFSRRKDPEEHIIDLQIKKAKEKDMYRPVQRLEHEIALPRKEIYEASQRKDYRPLVQKKKGYDSKEEYQRLDKDNFELPVQRKDIYEPVRQKWKHTRRRPIRPGAHALPLAMLASNVNRPPERDSPVSLKMDRDDVDQLIKDTGFNPYSKQKKT